MNKKKTEDKERFNLNINETLFFSIQEATGESTYQILEFFYNIMHKQKKEIDSSPKDVEEGERRYPLTNKKSYGFYPNTKVYFVASTFKRQYVNMPYLPHNRPFTGDEESIEYECKVSIPRNMLSYDHEKLKEIMADGLLLGCDEPKVASPHEKTLRKKNSVEALRNSDDTTD